MPSYDLPTLAKRIRALVDERKHNEYTLMGEVRHLEKFESGYRFELCQDTYALGCFVANKLRFTPAEKMRLAVKGHVQLWEKDTRLQIRASEVSPTDQPANIQESAQQLTRAFEKRFAEEIFTVNGVVKYRKNHYGIHYFDLIDAASLINCEVPKSLQVGKLETGKTIDVTGKLSLWKQTGKLQLIVSQIDTFPDIPDAFRPHIKKLTAKGLWPKAEREIPASVSKIGLITGKDTLAHDDIRKIFEREGSQVTILHQQARVQGANAPVEIIRALNTLSHAQNVDVIVITRGGGSEQDLEAFNDPEIAETICQSRIPVITAIGHAANTSLADVVADFQAFSPSDAAHILLKKSAPV